MATNDRERDAVRTVLKQMGRPTSYEEISSRTGPRHASALMELVQEGEVERIDAQGGSPALYRLSARGGTDMVGIFNSIMRQHRAPE